MDLFLPGLIDGLAVGGLYGLFALTLVMLHRATGIANFAQGTMAMFLAFVAFEAMRAWGLAPLAALVVTLPVAALGGAAVHYAVISPQRGTDVLNSVFRTLALMLLLLAIAVRLWGQGEPYQIESLFGSGSITVASYRVTALQLGAFATAIALAAGFGLLAYRTRWGLLMRGASADRSVAMLLGVRVKRVELGAWVVAGVLLVVVGLLFASFYTLHTDMMSGVLIKGFTAAIIGGLNSFRGAIVGGLIVGVMDSLLAVYTSPEWQAIAVFGILVAVLLLRPTGLFERAVAVRV